MRVEWEVVEVFACIGPQYGDHHHGLSLTVFSRHLSDQPFPPLAVRDASLKHGLPEPCLSMPAAGSQKAPRVSPFRSGCGRNDAAKEGDGDGRGRIFSEVTEKEGVAMWNRPRLWEDMASAPPHPALRATFSPAGEKKCAVTAAYSQERSLSAKSTLLVLLPAGEKCRSEARR